MYRKQNTRKMNDYSTCFILEDGIGVGFGAVFQLSLISNSLQGTLSPEIGMLSDSLGKYIAEKIYQDAPAHSLWASIRINLVILMVCLDCLCRFSIVFAVCTHWFDSL
jgi:hypothetical protein